jgi:hypothetical protein
LWIHKVKYHEKTKHNWLTKYLFRQIILSSGVNCNSWWWHDLSKYILSPSIVFGFGNNLVNPRFLSLKRIYFVSNITTIKYIGNVLDCNNLYPYVNTMRNRAIPESGQNRFPDFEKNIYICGTRTNRLGALVDKRLHRGWGPLIKLAQQKLSTTFQYVLHPLLTLPTGGGGGLNGKLFKISHPHSHSHSLSFPTSPPR